MLSARFEQRATRLALLEIFTGYHGLTERSSFTTRNLGLWASFLSAIDMEPPRYASFHHNLLECGFLNVAFDGDDIDPRDLDDREAAFRSGGADCLMVPCVRTANARPLLDRGYTPIQSFFDCRAKLEGSWQDHVRRYCKPRGYLNLNRQMRLLEPHYRTEWVTLGHLVADEKLFARACAIYVRNAQKFAHPAIHFSSEVMRALARSPYADDFRIALTFSATELVKIALCFVDEAARYIAFLVQGIDYDAVPDHHNLYNQIYVSIYEFMSERRLDMFDMGRGFVEQKVRLGCNIVDPLYTYLMPLNARAQDYVQRIRIQASTLRVPDRARPYLLSPSHAAAALSRLAEPRGPGLMTHGAAT